MSKLNGLIFDLDGTLVNSLGPTLDAFNEAITAFGKPRHSPAEIMAYFGTGEREILARIVGHSNADEAYRICRESMDSNMGKMPLHDGVAEMLAELRRLGLPVSIVTGRGEGSTQEILRHHGLTDGFVTVICHEHVSRSKPDPEGVSLALRRMKLAPTEACYVGDMVADMRAAHGAGTRAVAALWDGFCHRDEVLAHEPHHSFDHPRQILDLLTQLQGG